MYSLELCLISREIIHEALKLKSVQFGGPRKKEVSLSLFSIPSIGNF